MSSKNCKKLFFIDIQLLLSIILNNILNSDLKFEFTNSKNIKVLIFMKIQ